MLPSSPTSPSRQVDRSLAELHLSLQNISHALFLNLLHPEAYDTRQISSQECIAVYRSICFILSSVSGTGASTVAEAVAQEWEDLVEINIKEVRQYLSQFSSDPTTWLLEYWKAWAATANSLFIARLLFRYYERYAARLQPERTLFRSGINAWTKFIHVPLRSRLWHACRKLQQRRLVALTELSSYALSTRVKMVMAVLLSIYDLQLLAHEATLQEAATQETFPNSIRPLGEAVAAVTQLFRGWVDSLKRSEPLEGDESGTISSFFRAALPVFEDIADVMPSFWDQSGTFISAVVPEMTFLEKKYQITADLGNPCEAKVGPIKLRYFPQYGMSTRRLPLTVLLLALPRPLLRYICAKYIDTIDDAHELEAAARGLADIYCGGVDSEGGPLRDIASLVGEPAVQFELLELVEQLFVRVGRRRLEDVLAGNIPSGDGLIDKAIQTLAPLLVTEMLWRPQRAFQIMLDHVCHALLGHVAPHDRLWSDTLSKLLVAGIVTSVASPQPVKATAKHTKQGTAIILPQSLQKYAIEGYRTLSQDMEKLYDVCVRERPTTRPTVTFRWADRPAAALYGHTAVLAFRVPALLNLPKLEGDFGSDVVVQVPEGLSVEVLRVVLRYAYCGNVWNVIRSGHVCASDVRRAAAAFALPLLEGVCDIAGTMDELERKLSGPPTPPCSPQKSDIADLDSCVSELGLDEHEKRLGERRELELKRLQLHVEMEQLSHKIAEQLSKDLHLLYDSGLYTDVDVDSEGSGFRCGAHTMLLAARCPFMQSLLRFREMAHSSENRGPSAAIARPTIQTGLSDELCQALLQFVYTGHCEITPENATELLGVASTFQIESLMNLVDAYLVTAVDHTNVRELVVLSEDYGASQLRAVCAWVLLRTGAAAERLFNSSER